MAPSLCQPSSYIIKESLNNPSRLSNLAYNSTLLLFGLIILAVNINVSIPLLK